VHKIVVQSCQLIPPSQEHEDLQLAKKMSMARRSEFLKGRQLLRNLAAEFLEVEPNSIEFIKCGRKLRIIEPSDLFCSISHTDGWISAVIADHEIGIDIELSTRDIDIIRVAKRFFHSSEYKWIMESDDPNYSALKLWVLKEAHVKFKGSTLSRELSNAKFDKNFNMCGYISEIVPHEYLVIGINYRV